MGKRKGRRRKYNRNGAGNRAGSHRTSTRRKTSNVIKAKPTTYRGIHFKSRLEAKWAIFLDHCPLVMEWSYEYQKFVQTETGWEYTPDFCFRTGLGYGVIEVKPTMPSEEYVHVMSTFGPQLRGTFYLAYGSFYQKELPFLSVITNGVTPDQLTANKLLLKDVFHDVGRSITAVDQYRFDLPWKDQQPQHKVPGTIPSPELKGWFRRRDND